MVTACFDKREHLGGKHVHQKMPVDDDHPKKPCVLTSLHTVGPTSYVTGGPLCSRPSYASVRNRVHGFRADFNGLAPTEWDAVCPAKNPYRKSSS